MKNNSYNAIWIFPNGEIFNLINGLGHDEILQIPEKKLNEIIQKYGLCKSQLLRSSYNVMLELIRAGFIRIANYNNEVSIDFYKNISICQIQSIKKFLYDLNNSSLQICISDQNINSFNMFFSINEAISFLLHIVE